MSEPVLLVDDAYNTAGALRAASIGIALYDFLATLPSTIRYYKEQWNAPHITLNATLFFLIQVTSIFVLVVSNVGFFYPRFTPHSCELFHLWPSVFKMCQGAVSHVILGTRTYNLSKRSWKVGTFLVTLMIACLALEGLTTFYSRKSLRDPNHGNCVALSQGTQFLAAWTYYVVAIFYDLATTLISMYYLFKFKAKAHSSILSHLIKIMVFDGIGYFIVLAGTNVLNLMVYRTNGWGDGTTQIPTAGASLGYCFTWIMSQRLLMHLHDASHDRRLDSIDAVTHTITQNIISPVDVSRAVRSQFESKGGIEFELTVPNFSIDYDPTSSTAQHRQTTVRSSDAAVAAAASASPPLGTVDSGDAVDVQVRIEKTVKRSNRRQRTYVLEDYSRTGTTSVNAAPRTSIDRPGQSSSRLR